MLTVLIIVIFLIVQFRYGWIRTDRTWESVVVNLGPTLFIFGVYVIYHLAHAAYVLDNTRGTDADLLIAGLAETEDELRTERTTAKLSGEFHQVYIEDGTMDDAGCCFFVTTQLSVWNNRNVPTSIREVEIKVIAQDGEHCGKKVTSKLFSYFEKGSEATAFYDVAYPIEEQELPFDPLPEGYKRGQPQREKWLRFRAPLVWDDILTTGSLKSKIIGIVLIVIDTDRIRHKIVGLPPWTTRGRVDYSPLDTTFSVNLKTFHAFVDLHNKGKTYYEQARKGGSLVAEYEIQGWVGDICELLRNWRGTSYAIEFSSLEDKLPSVELISTSAEHRKRSAFLHPRLEKLVEYIRQIEEQRAREP